MSNHILVAYFSRKGENWWKGCVRRLEMGNTERAAEYIAEVAGGALFAIVPEKSYPAGYTLRTVQAKKELLMKERVPYRKPAGGLPPYDILFIGYPNWWGTMPQAVATFLSDEELAGKVVIPFCTNEGSGMGKSGRDLIRLCSGADIREGLSIIGSEVEEREEEIRAWAEKAIRNSELKAAAAPQFL